VCQEVVPELLLELHPHQSAALRRMLQREQRPTTIAHPTLRALPAPPSNTSLLADCAAGRVAGGEVPELHDVRGGFCCDEPGLGKTVTSIALILKTLGLVAAPPPGTVVCARAICIVDAQSLVARELHGRVYVSAPSAAAAPSAFSRRGSKRVMGKQRAFALPSCPPTIKRRRTSQGNFEVLLQPLCSDDGCAEHAADTGGGGVRHPATGQAAALRAGGFGGGGVPLSGATLIVVPPTLVRHWQAQMAAHVKAGTLRVYALLDCDSAAIDAEHLAWDYDVVITTFSLLSSSHVSRYKFDDTRTGEPHVALRVHWLRVILDEGHLLGSTAITDRLRMACSLRAERRWVLTGTPTPSTPSAQVAALHPLLSFLRVQPYAGDVSVWEDGIRVPFEACRRLGVHASRCLLVGGMSIIPWFWVFFPDVTPASRIIMDRPPTTACASAPVASLPLPSRLCGS
jgi:hypothetical protein